MRQIGIRRSVEALWRSPRLDGESRPEIEAYCSGVNVPLCELAAPGETLPEPFRRLGITPAPWTPVDALAFPEYMAWGQSGSDTAVWMGRLLEKLGAATVEELFPIDRPYEISTVPTSAAAASRRRLIPARLDDPAPTATADSGHGKFPPALMRRRVNYTAAS